MASKISKFNSTNIKEVRSLIDQKLAELAELGLTIKLGNISYDENSFKSQVMVTLTEAGDAYAVEFNKKAKYTGSKLVPGQKVKNSQGQIVIFRGYKPNARTKICIFEQFNRLYRCDEIHLTPIKG